LGGAPICPECKRADEEDFKRVKEYLYENPGASLSQVSTALDVSVEKIKRFLREGRLEIVNQEGNFFLECERCGKAITTGRFCDECEKQISHSLRQTADQMSQGVQAEIARKTSGIRYLSKETAFGKDAILNKDDKKTD